MNILDLTKKIFNRESLSLREAEFVANGMLEGKFTNSQTAAFLTCLAMKGESVDEILGFVNSVRKHMVKVENSENAIDVCGTGGDGKGTFNISTAVAFVVAGAGVKVAKHGNRAASSLCGSADVLEELGVNINLDSAQAVRILEKTGIVFLFAPNFHPAFKNVGGIRKELGMKTIFNYIGPFANPAKTPVQIIGVPNIETAKKLSFVAKKLNYKKLFILTSEDGLDEASLNAKTIIFEIKNANIVKRVVDPKQFGFESSKEDILGKSPKENASIIKNILQGVEKGAKRNIVILNSALALVVCGKARTVKEGIKIANLSIDRGDALNVLKNFVKEGQKYAKLV